MPLMQLSDEEARIIKQLRATARRDHPKRTAYISNLWAFIPDRVLPGAYRRVKPVVVLHACKLCNAAPGHLCQGAQGDTLTPHVYRGDSKMMSNEKRIAAASALVAEGHYDHIDLCTVTTTFRKDVDDG